MDHQLKGIYDQAKHICVKVAKHYGGSEETLEDRHWDKLNRILSAPSVRDAEFLAKKAEDSVFMTCLHKVAGGKLPGPNTPELWEGKARKAESLVKYFEKEALSKFLTDEERVKMLAKADKMKVRAAKIRDYVCRLKADGSLPPLSMEGPEPQEIPVEVVVAPPVVESPPVKKRGRPKKTLPQQEPAPIPVVEEKKKRRVVGIPSGTRRKPTK